MSFSEDLRHLNVQQLVGRMSDRERSDYHRHQKILEDSMNAQKKQADKEHSDLQSQTEERLLGKAEKSMYGDMTKVQLQHVHTEIDQSSKHS